MLCDSQVLFKSLDGLACKKTPDFSQCGAPPRMQRVGDWLPSRGHYHAKGRV